jgi:pimeloyl-ACP methyl ester carboxylesterase
MSLAVRTVRTTINAVSLIAPGAAGRLAFEVWRRPLVRSRVRTADRAIHDTASVEFVDGIVTYAWGDGRRPVLLVHGWRSRASRYAAFVARLLELGYSPISYDAPGHGDTAGPAGTILDHQRIIRQLAEKYGTFEGVIAHSLGAPFALYAIREGVAAGRVVTISGVCEFEYLVDTFCQELRLRPKVNQTLRRAIERGLFQGDRGIWTRFSATQPAEADLLVVHNDLDEVVDPAQAARLVTAYGESARLLQTTGLGHSRILSDPTVIEQSTAFLSGKVPAE